MPNKKQNNPTPVSFDALTGLAQELNAPLQSLTNVTQQILDKYRHRDFEYIAYKDFKSLMESIELMNRQLKSLNQKTGQLLMLTKSKKKSHSGHSNLNEVVRDVLALLSQQLQLCRIKVVLLLDEAVPLISLDKIECHQVVHNVLLNAIQAMPAGGKIKIQSTFNKTVQLVSLNVEDEGVGITPEHLDKIFEPFFTTKERGIDKSSGLGLSIVYSIVRAAGGDINIQSSLRKGTLVHIDLPSAKTTP